MVELKITTFNIRCFGFNGEYFGKDKVEERTPHLFSFLQENFSDTDVFVFQEIMNPLIIDRILPEDFKTYTYEHEFKRHMFIVFACRKGLEIKDFQTIEGTALDNERSRPAVYGCLLSDNQPILDLLGVHLKSKQDHSDNRIKQCKTISNFIGTLPDDRPKVMTGDFNSHLKEKTFKSEDDLRMMEDVFKDQMTLIGHKSPTYLAANEEMSLDHFFVSAVSAEIPTVYSLPDYSETQSFKKYYDEISDHLPVTIQLIY